MSVTFSSLFVTLPPAEARRALRMMRSSEHTPPVRDADGGVVHEVTRATSLSLGAARRVMQGRPPGAHDLEAAWVTAVPRLSREGAHVLSQNFPALSVADRVLAIPHGVPLLYGRASRRIAAARRARDHRRWMRMIERLGGEAAAASTLVPYFDRYGNGEREARQLLARVRVALASTTPNVDLLLAACDLEATMSASAPRED